MPKIKLENDKVRKSYYAISDKINQAKDELSKLNAPAINKKLKSLQKIRYSPYKDLENGYI